MFMNTLCFYPRNECVVAKSYHSFVTLGNVLISEILVQTDRFLFQAAHTP